MIRYICDFCKKECESFEVKTEGVAPIKGWRILLPDPCWSMQFCKTKCFWDWIETQTTTP